VNYFDDPDSTTTPECPRAPPTSESDNAGSVQPQQFRSILSVSRQASDFILDEVKTPICDSLSPSQTPKPESRPIYDDKGLPLCSLTTPKDADFSSCSDDDKCKDSNEQPTCGPPSPSSSPSSSTESPMRTVLADSKAIEDAQQCTVEKIDDSDEEAIEQIKNQILADRDYFEEKIKSLEQHQLDDTLSLRSDMDRLDRETQKKIRDCDMRRTILGYGDAIASLQEAQKASEERIQALDEENKKLRELVDSKDEELQRLNELVVANKEQLETLSEAVAAKDEQLRNPNEALVDSKDEELQRLNELVVANKEQLETLSEAVAAKDEQLRNLNEALNAKDEQMRNLNEALNAKDEQLRNLEERLDSLTNALNDLASKVQASRSMASAPAHPDGQHSSNHASPAAASAAADIQASMMNASFSSSDTPQYRYSLEDFNNGRFPSNGDPLLLDDDAFKVLLGMTREEYIRSGRVKQYQAKERFWGLRK